MKSLQCWACAVSAVLALTFCAAPATAQAQTAEAKAAGPQTEAADQGTSGAPPAPRQRVAPRRVVRKKAEPAAAAADDGGQQEGADEAESPQPRVTLLRPTMTAGQRTEWASRLRQIYAQPPARWPPPMVDRSVKWQELGKLPAVVHPADNPHSENKALLGGMLFFEPRLSGSGQMACASCHDPELQWSDHRSTAIGNHRKVLKRNTPSILNAAYNERNFWDGRAGTLEQQAKAVLSSPDEMASSEKIIVQRLANITEYRDQFRTVFNDDTVTLERVAAAIACFERGIVGGQSRFDAFVQGKPEALPDEAVIGLHLFRTEARCMNCHHGPNFSDGQFHDLGLSYYGRTLEDLGRHRITKTEADVGRFKTPTLRNVARTAPYMHNGLFPLQGVLNLYNVGMPTLRRKEQQQDDKLFPTKSPLLQQLNMNRQDLDAIAAFLESLNEPNRRFRLPKLPADATAQTPSDK